MLITHEAPLKIMDKVQGITDYDYCLVHLMEENEEYRKFFFDAKAKGRHIIMDCSTYELGTSYDWEKYFEWISKLQPDEYIIPDVFQDKEANFKNFEKFLATFPVHLIPGKRIGVIQGKTYDEMVESYNFMAEQADKIAISFGYDFFIKTEKMESKSMCYAVGRYNLLNRFIEDGIIDYHKPHHLLGCGAPTEFWSYGKDNDPYKYCFIESIDTSHPVIMGFFGLDYDDQVNTITKRPEKMIDIFEEEIPQDKWIIIESNIKTFKKNILCR